MFKKILLIIVISSLLLISQIWLNQVTADSSSLPSLVVNTGSNVGLELAGYKINYSNVNFNQAGTYFVKYLNIATNEEVTRTVKVINNQDLITNGILEITKTKQVKTSNYEVIKTIPIPKGYASLCCDDKMFYLVIEQNLEINSYTIISKAKCSVADIIYDEQSKLIYGYGHYFNQRLIDIFLCSYTINGKLKMMTVTGGIKQDEISDFIIVDDVIILCGKTRSADGIFEHNLSAEDSFIAVYDKISGDFIKYYNLGLEGIDYVSKMIFLEDLYVVIHYYYQNVAMTKIVQIDLNYQTTKEVHLKHYQLITSIDLKTDGNDIYYLCKSYDENTKKVTEYLYQLTTDLKLTLIDEYAGDGFKATSICANFDHIIITYQSDYNSAIRIVDTDEQLLVFDDAVGIKSYILENHIYLKNSKDEISIYQLEYLAFKETAGFYQLFYQKQLIKPNEDLSFNDYNPLIFGNYNLRLGYQINNMVIIYQDQVRVQEAFNISNNNCYQKGIILEFNAEGYLNGEKILNKTMINEVGTYYLELVGHLNETKYYQIEVVDISYDIPNFKTVEITKQEIEQASNELLLVSNHPTENLAIKKDVSQELWLIIIPIVLFSGGVFLYFYLKEVKKCYQ